MKLNKSNKYKCEKCGETFRYAGTLHQHKCSKDKQLKVKYGY